MDKLKCKACGSYGMVPMEVVVTGEDDVPTGLEQASNFYTCHVCSDNWLSVKETDDKGKGQITFIHQMGMAPVLKRIAHLKLPISSTDNDLDHWDYFLDDVQIGAEIWFDKLRNRRRILKSICCN